MTGFLGMYSNQAIYMRAKRIIKVIFQDFTCILPAVIIDAWNFT